ncbi:MAG: chromate resistance protein [Chthoniobacterales bacterium]|nr:chromate resistance protein [Chthoniobacterales bacterium]
MESDKWILLLYELPTKKSSERVNLWRRLKKFGALSLKTSAYLLPDTPTHFERFQWLAQQIRDGGGEATLIRVSEIENLSTEAVTALFNEARAADYQEMISSLTELLKQNRERKSETFQPSLDRFRARFSELREIDFFDSPRAHDVEMLLQRAASRHTRTKGSDRRLSRKDYSGKTWLTRPRPEIDRVGSAWLIEKFVDAKATFVFAASSSKYPKAIPFDMLDVEFTHHGEDCTFETLLERFAIEDKGARIMAEMIHDADLEDDKFHRQECVGLQRLFMGWARLGLTDAEILDKGFACFDALHASVRK